MSSKRKSYSKGTSCLFPLVTFIRENNKSSPAKAGPSSFVYSVRVLKTVYRENRQFVQIEVSEAGNPISIVWRRFEDAGSLHRELVQKFGDLPRPPFGISWKLFDGSGSGDQIDKLESYLQKLLRHSLASCSEEVLLFLGLVQKVPWRHGISSTIHEFQETPAAESRVPTFTIKTRRGFCQWTVTRSHAEVLNLQHQLRRQHPHGRVPKLSQRRSASWTGAIDAFLAQKFLYSLLQDRSLTFSPEVLHFLGIALKSDGTPLASLEFVGLQEDKDSDYDNCFDVPSSGLRIRTNTSPIPRRSSHDDLRSSDLLTAYPQPTLFQATSQPCTPRVSAGSTPDAGTSSSDRPLSSSDRPPSPGSHSGPRHTLRTLHDSTEKAVTWEDESESSRDVTRTDSASTVCRHVAQTAGDTCGRLLGAVPTREEWGRVRSKALSQLEAWDDVVLPAEGLLLRPSFAHLRLNLPVSPHQNVPVTAHTDSAELNSLQSDDTEETDWSFFNEQTTVTSSEGSGEGAAAPSSPPSRPASPSKMLGLGVDDRSGGRPILIKNLSNRRLMRVIGEMVYNPLTMTWEGNEDALYLFDPWPQGEEGPWNEPCEFQATQHGWRTFLDVGLLSPPSSNQPKANPRTAPTVTVTTSSRTVNSPAGPAPTAVGPNKDRPVLGALRFVPKYLTSSGRFLTAVLLKFRSQKLGEQLSEAQ